MSGQLALYRSCTPVVDTHYKRGSDRTLLETLVGALAEAEGVDATELPPLQEAIDVDALVQLFERHEGETGMEAIVGFEYEGWNVFVRADGRISVCDAAETVEPTPVFERGTA